MIERHRICPDHLRLLPEAYRDSRELSDRNRGTAGRNEHDGRPGKTIRILIAGSHALIRAGYRALLAGDERMEVIAEAASGSQAIALATATRPNVVLLDVGLPDLDAIETVAAIASRARDAAVILIGPREADDWVISALEAGAAGVVRRDAESDELIRAVQVVAKGNALLSFGAVRRLLARLPPKPFRSRPQPSQLEELTPREREVMALAATGLSNCEIAERLVISPKTAKTHISRAMLKLGAHHRAQLVTLAYETGLVQAPDRGATRQTAPFQAARDRDRQRPSLATQKPMPSAATGR